MGKKDYQLFADAISLIENEEDRKRIISFLDRVFSQDNGRFNLSRFEEWIDRRRKHESMKGTNYNPNYMPLGVR